jgi:biotin operon repressor
MLDIRLMALMNDEGWTSGNVAAASLGNGEQQITARLGRLRGAGLAALQTNERGRLVHVLTADGRRELARSRRRERRTRAQA